MKKKRNNSMKRKMINGSLAAVLALTTIPLNIFPHTAKAAGTDSTVKMRFMETTDLHSNVMDWDYYKDTAVNNFGLDRTAVLIQQAREEQIAGYADGQTYTKVNSMLFDDGDLLQGNPLADYVHRNWNYNDPNAVHPLFRAMKMLDYDAGNVGNHEFNFGLNYLESVLKHAPYNDGGGRDGIVNANIYVDDHDNDPSNDKNYFKPYNIIDKVVMDSAGNQQHIKVGVIGFAPPQIMNWDKDNLQGKVIAKDMVETAKKFIPEMKANGADIIVALAHSGCDVNSEGQQDAENAVYSLTNVPGIDVMLFGHAHVNFPGDIQFNNKAGIDNKKGTINNVPAMEAGFWGNNLGVMDLTLQNVNGKWTITDSEAALRPVTAVPTPDQKIINDVKPEHDATLNYVRAEIGKTSAPMYSYFAQVQDDPTVQIVNNAQTEYVKKWIADNKPELSNIPVLSAGAPFKAGGTSGPAYYTEINAGPLSIMSANDLYLYPNTLKAIEITGATVREWLEMSAGQFNTIDPNNNNPQNIINPAFKSYNFDVIDGVKYQIDITKPPKYSGDGLTVLNPNSHRVVNLTMPDGTPVKDDQKFIVATNNYRAGGGGNFPGIDGKEKYIIDSQKESREVLMDYIKDQGTVNPTADNNWSLARINETVQLTFLSAPKAKTFADQSNNLKYLDTVQDAKNQTWGNYQLAIPPDAPKVDKVIENATKVSGTAEAGSTVEVKADNKLIGSAVAGTDGKFSVDIPVQKVGTELSVTAKDAANVVSTATTVKVADVTAPAIPKLDFDDISQFDTFVSGTAEPGSKVEVKVDGKVIGSDVAEEDGYFEIEFPAQKVGTQLVITATDASGNVSEPTVTTVYELQSGWVKEEGKWYYVDPTTGELKTGWFKDGNKWYYLDPTDFDMKTGWVKVNNKWYYLDPTNGDMKAGWVKVNNKWYYLDPINGDMKAGWVKVSNKWYYLDPTNGDMKVGWIKVANKWYYLDPVKGDMKAGWVKVANKWYYLDPVKGDMKTGWVKVNNKWYYLATSGAMQTGWVQVGKKWYFLYNDGSMASNTKIGKYKVGKDGARI